MHARPLRVLIAASDRELLRCLSRFLEMFGYEVSQANRTGSALTAVQDRRPDILILDESLSPRDGWDLCRSVRRELFDAPLKVFLLATNIQAEEVATAVAVGVDDFLAKPLNYGEILARLRAGARSLEFDRRAKQQAKCDPVTKLLTRSTLERALTREEKKSEESEEKKPLSCVAFAFDFLHRVRLHHGRDAEPRFYAAIAAELPNWLPTGVLAARIESNTVAVALPGFTMAEARDWANELRAHLRDTEVRIDNESFAFTASFGISQRESGEHPSEVISKAEEALETAQISGGDYVVAHGDFEEEFDDLVKATEAAQLFQRTCARDVMQPCTITLRTNEKLGAVARVLESTGLPGVPVVDENKKLVGCVTMQQVDDYRHRTTDVKGTAIIEECLGQEFLREAEQTSFAKLMLRFGQFPEALIVIESQGKPTGLVTLNSLAALSQPLTTSTFVSKSLGTNTRDLAVKDSFQIAP